MPKVWNSDKDWNFEQLKFMEASLWPKSSQHIILVLVWIVISNKKM